MAGTRRLALDTLSANPAPDVLGDIANKAAEFDEGELTSKLPLPDGLWSHGQVASGILGGPEASWTGLMLLVATLSRYGF